MTDIMKLDLYELLSVSYESTEQEMKSAYRRLALGCHPDKNPDDPKAVELFHRLSKALEILTDSTAKSAYDRLLRARKATVVRHKNLDQKRQKLKDELEARERSTRDDVVSEAEATHRLNREIERLRKEGSKLLETEKEILMQQIRDETKRNIELDSNPTKSLPKIKVIKKSKEFGFDSENLRQFFSRFGEINALVLNRNKKKALIEFKDYKHSVSAYESREQFQHLFAIELIGDKAEDIASEQRMAFKQTNEMNGRETEAFSTEYENLVLRNLRRAQERKQLIEQLEEEEEQQQNDG